MIHPAIELFRGIAAWMVLTSHYAHFFGEGKTWLSFLWTGVDFFFVMSGFVFAPTLYHHFFNLKAYLIRRFFRIYPLYASSLLLYYIFSEFHPQKLLFLIKHLLFLQTTHSLEEAFFFNPAYWSLPVEIEYYLFIPLFAFLIKKIRYFLFILFLSAFALTYLIASQAAELTTPNIYTVLSFHLPNILIEFMLGIILFHLYDNYQRKKRTLWIPVGLFLGGFLLLGYLSRFFWQYGDEGINHHFVFKAYFNFFCAVGYSAILFPCLLLINSKKSYFYSFCLAMGNFSYGVYLLHYLILTLFQRFYPSIQGWTAYLSCAMAVLSITLLLHYLIEQPLRDFGRTWSKKW